MLKRPTSRRKTQAEGITLNLVPVLDALVTLIAFLLFSMAFLAVVSIESPFPQASPNQVQEQLKEKPLQLTLTVRDKEAEIWSPFELVPSKTIPHLEPGKPNLHAIHEALVAIKQKHPKETKLVLVPYGMANYELLITVMDASRMLEPTDPPIFVKNEVTGNDEPMKSLFPDILFGNLLGDDR